MQVNQENIQRPSLIEPCLNMELSPTNDFIQYIDCSVKSSNVVHKKNNVTSDSHNIKKSLKNENYNRHADNPLSFGSCIVFDKWYINHPLFHYAKDITTKELGTIPPQLVKTTFYKI